MVGDDHLHPECRGLGNLVGGGDPAVDGDQKPDARGRQPLDGTGTQAISLLEPAGQVPLHIGIELSQRKHGQSRGADPVGVVVTVDADPAVLGDRGQDPLAGDRHVAE